MSHYYHKSVLSISHNAAYSSAINGIFPSLRFEVKKALALSALLEGSQEEFLGYSFSISEAHVKANIGS